MTEYTMDVVGRSLNGTFVAPARSHRVSKYSAIMPDGETIVSDVSLREAKDTIAMYRSLFGETFDGVVYTETYTRTATDDILFPKNGPRLSSHVPSHVSSHVSPNVAFYVDGHLVADVTTEHEARERINAMRDEARWGYLAALIEFALNPMFSLEDTIAVLQRTDAMPPMVETLGAYLVYVDNAESNAPTPEGKTKRHVVAKENVGRIKERRYSGVPESVLQAHGYSVLDASSLRVLMSGTKETIKEYFAQKDAPKLRDTRIVKYTNVWRYVQRVYCEGYTAFVQGKRVVSGTRNEVDTFLRDGIKAKRFAADAIVIKRVERSPLPVAAYVMRMA